MTELRKQERDTRAVDQRFAQAIINGAQGRATKESQFRVDRAVLATVGAKLFTGLTGFHNEKIGGAVLNSGGVTLRPYPEFGELFEKVRAALARLDNQALVGALVALAVADERGNNLKDATPALAKVYRVSRDRVQAAYTKDQIAKAPKKRRARKGGKKTAKEG